MKNINHLKKYADIHVNKNEDHDFLKKKAFVLRKIFDNGRRFERIRIMKLLDTTRMCTCKPTCQTDINIYAFVLEELGVDLFKLISGEQK